MPKLPNYAQARVPLPKLATYALNPAHPVGKHKARVFRAALGLTQADAVFLQREILRAAHTHDAVPEAPSPYGDRYLINFDLQTEAGRATVRTAWLIPYGDDAPHLTTC